MEIRNREAKGKAATVVSTAECESLFCHRVLLFLFFSVDEIFFAFFNSSSIVEKEKGRKNKTKRLEVCFTFVLPKVDE